MAVAVAVALFRHAVSVLRGALPISHVHGIRVPVKETIGMEFRHCVVAVSVIDLIPVAVVMTVGATVKRNVAEHVDGVSKLGEMESDHFNQLSPPIISTTVSVSLLFFCCSSSLIFLDVSLVRSSIC